MTETTPEPQPGLQGEGGFGRYQGREDAGRTGRTIRCPSEPDHDLEIAASRRGCRGLWRRDETRFKSARDRCENAARQDRGVDAGTRFFVRSARESRTFAERKAMIDRNDDLPVSRQAKVLGISRGSVYYLPRPVSADDLALMRRIDELHLDYPFAGSRMLQTFLAPRGIRCRAPPRRHADEADGN